MLGYRRANLDLTNKFYSSSVEVRFIKVEEEHIGRLMHELKNLKYEVERYYEHDQLLLEETAEFIKVCRSVVGTVYSYSIYFRENDELIKNYFTLTKKRVYTDLFKKNIQPIIDLLKTLRNERHNAYIDSILKLMNENYFPPKHTYILTKKKFAEEYIDVNGIKYKVMKDKEFLELGIYAEVVIFLGTPSYFDSKFSVIFYGKQTMFLGYTCFENRLVKRQSFSDLISNNHLINTIYEGVRFDKGFTGIDFRETFLTESVQKSEESVVNKFENLLDIPLEEKVEVKLATISHSNYIFLPIRQKVSVINRESLKVSQEKVKNLSAGDLLVFRSLNASSLVREEADKIMGNSAVKYRESLEKWKKKLRLNVERKGIEKVSKILEQRYGILVAKENNIKNWMGKHSIKPSCLSELLDAFKFDLQEKTEILDAASEIRRAHTSAGRHISHTLMNELDKNLESVIDENGFYTFESKKFEGSFFNIEEIKKISIKTYFIPETETLKIIKG